MIGICALLGIYSRAVLLGGIFGGILAVLFIILFALIRSGLCDALASVLPLVFTRPILSIGEFFRKSGEKKA